MPTRKSTSQLTAPVAPNRRRSQLPSRNRTLRMPPFLQTASNLQSHLSSKLHRLTTIPCFGPNCTRSFRAISDTLQHIKNGHCHPTPHESLVPISANSSSTVIRTTSSKLRKNLKSVFPERSIREIPQMGNTNVSSVLGPLGISGVGIDIMGVRCMIH